MLLPACTGSGEPVLVTERSAVGVGAFTWVVAVALLLSGLTSQVSLEIVTVLLMTVPSGVLAFTFTTSVNVALAPAANVERLAVTDPVPPTIGVVSVNAGPLVCVKETNVVFAGIASVIHTFCASFGPAFAAPIE